MFSNVLIGVDVRQGGRDAIALAEQLAAPGASLTLPHVYGLLLGRGAVEALALERAEAQQLLERERDAASVDATLIARGERPVGQGLHELAGKLAADLLVVGSCRRALLGRAMLGDDARAALDGTPCAIAVAPRGYAQSRQELHSVGVGYDGSPESERALDAARELARRHGATVKALWVVSLQDVREERPIPADWPRTAELLVGRCRDQLRRLARLRPRRSAVSREASPAISWVTCPSRCSSCPAAQADVAPRMRSRRAPKPPPEVAVSGRRCDAGWPGGHPRGHRAFSIRPSTACRSGGVNRQSRSRQRVLIVGGGVAAVETLLALRELAGHRVELTLLSPEREFLYRPVTVAEAFDRGEARSYALAEIVGHGGGRLVWDALERVDAHERVAVTASGERIAYDVLVVAAGAIAREPFPGALTFRGRGDVAALRALLEELVGGKARSLALTLPSERMCALPLYELALMTAADLRERGSHAEVCLVTPEEEPLELFGPSAARAIEPMLRARGVRLRTSSRPALVRRRALVLAGGAEVYVDRVLTLPQLEGPRLPGLPHDMLGFIPVDEYGRVQRLDDVYAAGDITAFPLKQGGLAAQQADAVAETIAAELGLPVTPRPFRPVLRGLLLTGGAPLYLRAEPQRLPCEATVAIEATPLRRSTRDASSAAGQPLWWPPAKIAGRYLGPFLATARPQPLGSELLQDRVAVPGPPLSDPEFTDALELALLLADCDARWGDYPAALNALDAAEALQGTLLAEYQAKRREWRAAERTA